MKTEINVCLLFFLFMLLTGCDSCNSANMDVQDEEETLPYTGPPLEVFFFDQENRPPPSHPASQLYPDLTYTAEVYIANHATNQLHGPYFGSTFPNNKQSKNDQGQLVDRPKTVTSESFYFNNKWGHKGSTRKGLNLIKEGTLLRETPAWSWGNLDVIAYYINVHSGFSKKGSPTSRGSLGCLTIQPSDVNNFMSHFDFSIANDDGKYTMGNSSGIVYVSRTTAAKRQGLISQLKSEYE